jgi:YidC/Oxa1 family membrane protein insertase
MDTQRLILFFVFSFSLLLLWEAWQKETRGLQQAAVSTPQAVPAPSAPPKPADASKSAPSAAPPTQQAGVSGERVRITTDVVAAEIDTAGGDVVRLELLQHRDSRDPKKNVVLFGPEHRYAAQSGLIGQGLPNHRTAYSAAQKEYALKPGQDTVEVRLEAPGPEGVRTAKLLRFKRGSYLIDVVHELENKSSVPVAAHAYFQLTRDGKSPSDDNDMAPTYTGPVVHSEQNRFVKVDFSDIEKNKVPYARNADNGWIAMVQHYFVGALLPPEKAAREIYTRKLGENLYAAGVILEVAPVPPGGKASASTAVYVGPQEQSVLREIAPDLNLVVDYGLLKIIAEPLFWVLDLFHSWTGNWGIAIILLTVVIKLIFFPLSAASYRSMARMKLVAPRLTKIREQYPDDRMKQNQAMMDLYKTEKINPLGGCLPIAVQIPVFIALYWVLLAAVELRQAPFYGWITDLSQTDPWFVLPALMMGTMLIQTRMNPTPPDPVQAKVMMIMPFAFGIMFFFFPAGLVLYWLVNNVLSIAQQWQITRMIEGAAKTAPPKR